MPSLNALLLHPLAKPLVFVLALAPFGCCCKGH
jgi:hypothetical protein